MIHKARSMNPSAVVIAAGCYVQARAAELQMDTAVDILVGNQEKGRLLPILEAYWRTHPDRLPASLRAAAGYGQRCRAGRPRPAGHLPARG